MSRYSPDFLIRNGKTVITAHSGCEKTPDNSREHILAAIDSGAEMIEVDVRRADNGVLYLSHDVPDDIGIRPTLRDLFELIGPEENMRMNLDAKTEGLVEPVMALAKEYGLTGRIIFTGSCNSDRLLAKSLGADVWRSMWQGDSVPDGIRASKEDGSPYLNVHYSMITEEYDRELRKIGAGFSAWTVNDEENIRRFLKMGISNITTRTPRLALRLRKEIQGV